MFTLLLVTILFYISFYILGNDFLCSNLICLGVIHNKSTRKAQETTRKHKNRDSRDRQRERETYRDSRDKQTERDRQTETTETDSQREADRDRDRDSRDRDTSETHYKNWCSKKEKGATRIRTMLLSHKDSYKN